MLGDLLHHEFEVIANFFARGVGLVASEQAIASAQIDAVDSPENDWLEDMLCGPHGPIELENVFCRATIYELNALVEAVLQRALEKVGHQLVLPDGQFIIGADRAKLTESLKAKGLEVETFPCYDKVSEIQEIANGFKHRQRLRPVPRARNWEELQKWPETKVPGSKGNLIESYELTARQVSDYLVAVRTFLEHCSALRLI